MIFRCSKCGEEYNQMKQFKLVKVRENLSIYHTRCCDTTNIEVVETGLLGGCEVK